MKNDSLNYLKLNVKGLSIGFFLLILGYTILGWQSYNAFAWHKMVLAPILLVIGYAITGFSLMILPRK
ncbi:MAG: hypothetical protein Q8928_07895 [Bacteroidota bacterium]|nr:hypothetical protein [Bacteroidota bacterium]